MLLVRLRKEQDMKIEYEFVNGEINEVEVDAALGAQILETEHKMELRDRAETRRHDSYDALRRKGVQFADMSEPGVEESALACGGGCSEGIESSYSFP